MMDANNSNASDSGDICLETELNGTDMSNTVVYNTFFKNTWLLPYIVILALFCLFVVVAYYSGIYQFPFLLVAASIAIIFVLVFSFLSAKMVGKGRTETKKRQYVINADGIATTLSPGEKPFLHPWKEVYEVRETGKYIFIYLNAADILILPKRCFDAETLDRLRVIITAQIGPKRRRLKK